MILITGGSYQGKREYAKAEYRLKDEDIWDAGGAAGAAPPALDLSGKAIDHLELFILECVRQGVSAQEYLKAHEGELADKILIAADITQGVVPMDRIERAWREETGRCLVQLSMKADRVVRVFCGIPQVVKETEKPGKRGFRGRSYIVLLRHGLTEGNLKRWFYGGVDIPLAEKGREQLKKQRESGLYPAVPEDAQYFTSGMQRAEESLRIVYGEHEPEAIEDLTEMNFGEFECKSWDELQHDPDFIEYITDETGQSAPKGAEARTHFSERVVRGTQTLLNKHRLKEWSHRHGGEDACSVVMCHGGVISAMMQNLFPQVTANMFDWIPDPGLGYVIELSEGEPVGYEAIDIVKNLGFGFMRLPVKDGAIDLELTKRMVDRFMADGYNYFDTSFNYMEGESEVAMRKALVERYPRERFLVATKLPAWEVSTEEEAKQIYYTSKERLGVDYFDYYLLHNLGANRTEAFDRFHIWEFLLEKKRLGEIKHLGFSIHDKADVLEKVLREHADDIDFVQLQINYADWDYPRVEGRKCYEIARRFNKPIVIMEPVKGGNLAGNLPPAAAEILKEADPAASPASWALRFCGSLPGVLTILSGMSDMEMLEDNLATMNRFRPLSAEDRKVLERAVEAINSAPKVPCTFCRYCVAGCPMDIEIPGCMRALNVLLMYQNKPAAKGNYGWETRGGRVASKCIGCGQCESACPQHINIIEQLKRAAEEFEE